MKKILIVAHKHSKHYGLFDDLRTSERALLRYCVLRPINSVFLKYLRHIHFSQKINRIIDLPYKYLWYDYHDVPSLVSEIQSILVIDLALEDPYLLDVLKKCRKKKTKMKISLFYLNAIGSSETESRKDFKKAIENASTFVFDEKYTFDKGDSKTFGMRYLGFNYYSKHNIKNNYNPQYDIYYIGRSTIDRNDLLNAVYNMLISKNCIFDFHLKPQKRETVRLPGVKYIESKMLSYTKILEDLQNSKCILEILRENQKGPSLRYFEAVCYNKKLLTTNPEIVNFPYYDSRYMRYFSNPDDIDVEWLKDD